jgi:hypothetical protein
MIFPYVNILSLLTQREPTKPSNEIGHGLSLIPFDEDYCHLYKGDKQISPLIFRKGGLGGSFKDNYCELLTYTIEGKSKNGKNKYSFGTWVIINPKGEVVFTCSKSFGHGYLLGGCLFSYDEYLWNLDTGKAIIRKGYGSYINGKNTITLEHHDSTYYKEVRVSSGIYQINKNTGTLTKIDEIK